MLHQSHMGFRKGDVLQYFSDIKQFPRMYPWALFRSKIVRGYFDAGSNSAYQQRFFDALVKDGFKRTPWQLVLPGQTAGLIKRIPAQHDGANQCHVRFYQDGTIECELEYHNFHLRHWSGARRRDEAYLEGLLQELSHTVGEYAEGIRVLFGSKECGI